MLAKLINVFAFTSQFYKYSYTHFHKLIPGDGLFIGSLNDVGDYEIKPHV